MDEVSIVGVDLAKHVFQVHGAAADGRVLFRKKLSRAQFARFMGDVRPCIVAMEACGTSHYWGRVMEQLGHEVRLIPPIYVKPFIKRQKNDLADAEAIAEAALRPPMRMVPVKSSAQQARGMLFRTRELLVGQRTQMINALRAHLAEHGIVVPKGLSNLERLAAITRTHEAELPELMREMTDVYLYQIARISGHIAALETRILEEARKSTVVWRFAVCRVSARSAPWPLRLSPRQWRGSAAAETLRRGSASYLVNIRAVASKSSAAHRRWDNATFVAF